jgi:hypothetical protein
MPLGTFGGFAAAVTVIMTFAAIVGSRRHGH